MKSEFVFRIQLVLLFAFFFFIKGIIADENKIELPYQFSYIEDKLSSFLPEELLTKNFDNSLNISGFSNSAWWVRIDLDKVTLKNSILFLGYPLLDQVKFYYKVQEKWKIIETGDTLPFNSRIIKNKNFVFPLDETIESPIFLKIKTEGPVFIPLKIMKVHEYLDFINKENYFWGFYFGVVGVFLFYSFISFISMRDKTYLFYALHIFTFSLLQAVLNGITFEFLWPNVPYFANISPNFFHSLSLFFVLLFSIYFLKLKDFFPIAFKVLLIIDSIYFLFLFLSFYTPFYRFLLITQTYLILFSSVFVVVISILYLRKGFTPAKYHTAGWIVLFFAIIANRLKTVGLIPQNFFSTYGTLLASILEMCLFSLALGVRIIKIRQEKEESEKERQKLISDLHDNLGGDLTDIVYTLNKFTEKTNLQLSDVEEIRTASLNALNSLKTRIRSREEISLIEKNLVDGIRYHLIARYSNSGRKLKSFADEESELFFEEDNTLLPYYNDIYLICKEICTNDLKYGFGESNWNFHLVNNIFSIHLLTNTNYNENTVKGLGSNNLINRAEKINAKIIINRMENKYELTFEIKIAPPDYKIF
ncbi:MAG: 7TM diverse intracellular signaling domain-containing protein [Leptospiraceae bacterium]|nr:7TM diverse intracellular signaling domain-containing protein [Leptospiraceae bacterium]